MRSSLRTRHSARNCIAPCVPQPQTSAALLSLRDRYLAATAVAAAVLNAVIEIESITASGRPLLASQSTTTPWIVGKP